MKQILVLGSGGMAGHVIARYLKETNRFSVIGPDTQSGGIGLFNWFMAQSTQINGFSRAIWNGVTTITLAKAIEAAIDQNLSGLYHLVPSEPISKLNLVRLFNEFFKKNTVKVIEDARDMPDKTLVNTRKDFTFEIGSYLEQISSMKQWVKEHYELYPHYKIGSE